MSRKKKIQSMNAQNFDDIDYINEQQVTEEVEPVNVKLAEILEKSYEQPLPPDIEIEYPEETIEECRRLKSNMLSMFDNGLKSILLTSISPKEGCSTILFHLALSLVQSGPEKVLAIDCNFKNPALHKLFQTDAENGLSELIFRKTGIERAVKKTPYPNLFLLPAGKTGKISGRLLGSPEFDEIKKILELEFDYLLFDCASLKQSSDGLVLSRKVDGVVLVVQAHRTKIEVAQAIKKNLLHHDANVLGVVLNRRKYPIPNWLYRLL